jgi:hypothetical protein
VVFYASIGVAALVITGLCLAWPRIRVRYAVLRLNRVSFERAEPPPQCDAWVELCTRAARGGDRGAMDALIRQGDRLCWASLGEVSTWPARHRATFYEVLGAWQDRVVLQTLREVAEGIARTDLRPEDYSFETPDAPEDFVAAMEPLATESRSERVRLTAGELLAFVRRRFAARLALAARAEGLQEVDPGGPFPGLGIRQPEGGK